MIQKDSVILIDVRTPGEISQGYIEGADSFINFNSNDFATKINQLDKNYTYVMYCRSGGRSGKASEYMIKNGFSNVYNLQGGILQYKGALVQP
jgi:rhodanese-related sulfurtransferase